MQNRILWNGFLIDAWDFHDLKIKDGRIAYLIADKGVTKRSIFGLATGSLINDAIIAIYRSFRCCYYMVNEN